MGGGWLNSMGKTGDVTKLQCFTGGTHGTTRYQGTTRAGAGGGYMGIATVPMKSGGKYTLAPDILVSGGSGAGLQLASNNDHNGALSNIVVVQDGHGYDGTLPTIT